MWLVNGSQTVLVGSRGGSILLWQFRDKFILGPLESVTPKIRGVTHWCFPNFGRDPALEYEKHGFLRDTLLTPHNCRTHFAGFKGNTRDLEINTEVDLGVASLRMSLFVGNKGDKSVPVLPALHPYFAVPTEGLEIWMNYKPLLIEDFAAAPAFKLSGALAVRLFGIGVTYFDLPSTCTHVRIWSDQPGKYICVEPIFGDETKFRTPEGNWLRPGKWLALNIDMHFEPSA